MPAMHPADGIRMHRKRDVLMYTGIAPPHPSRIRIGAVVWRDTFQLAHLPLALPDFFQINPRTGHTLDLLVFVHPPTSKVMRAGNHPGRKPLSDPRMKNEVSDLGMDFD